MTTFKTMVIKSHQQTMDEFAAISDATINGEKVAEEEAQYSFTSFQAARASGIPQEVVEAAAPPKNREVETAKARARADRRQQE